MTVIFMGDILVKRKPDDKVADIGDGVPVPEFSRPTKAGHRGIDLNQKHT